MPAYSKTWIDHIQQGRSIYDFKILYKTKVNNELSIIVLSCLSFGTKGKKIMQTIFINGGKLSLQTVYEQIEDSVLNMSGFKNIYISQQ